MGYKLIDGDGPGRETSLLRMAWVRPRVDETILSWGKSLDEIVRRRDSIYRILAGECFGADDCFDVRIEELRADCPFCEEGSGQLLMSNNWIGLLDWSPARISRQAEILAGTHGPIDFNDAMRRFDRAFFNMLDDANSSLDESDGSLLRNVYGIDSFDLPLFDSRQLQMSFSDVPWDGRLLAGSFGSDLTGVCECPHCKSHFVVSHCNDKKDCGKGDGGGIREVLFWHADRGNGSFYELERLAVRLIQSDREVEVLYCLDDGEHSIVFDRYSGATRFDGCRISARNGYALTGSHPVFVGNLFCNPALVRSLSSMLSVPYDNLAWGSNCHNLKMLIAINRFEGYPLSFYEDVVQDERLFLHACDVCSAVPRRYEDLERLFALTGLPDKKSIKRRLLGNPLLLCAVALGNDIPFRNTDVICRFLDLPWSHPLFRLLLNPPYWDGVEAAALAVGLRAICEIKGDSLVFNYVASLSKEQLDEFASIMDDDCWMYSRTVKEAIARSPLKDLAQLLFLLSLENDNAGVDFDAPYCYSDDRRELEECIGEFTFNLPVTPRELVIASFELKNCLGRHILTPMVTDEVFVLIRKRGKYVGAALIDDGGRIVEAHSSCNRSLDAVRDLHEKFVEWCRRHDLAIS